MKYLILLCFLLDFSTLRAQHIKPDPESFRNLDSQRIATNQRGMIVLGSFSAANVAFGAAACLATEDKEWRAFHGMNAAWNVVNLAIAYGGYRAARKERGKERTCGDMLNHYESNKRLYLMNAGLDILYLGSGYVLNDQSIYSRQPEMLRGFGKAIMLQGGFLLIFDSVMFASHQSRNKKWRRLLEGLCVSGNGIGWQTGL